MRPRPEAALLFATCLWGSTFIVTKDVVATAPPLLYSLLRFGVATLGMLLWSLFAERGQARRTAWTRAALRDGCWLGLLNALGLALQVVGQVYTTASKSSFITSLNTPFTPVVALLVYRQRPGGAQTAAVLIATLGLVLLTYPADGARYNRGDFYTVGCAILYAVFIVESTRRARLHDASVLTMAQLASGTAIFAVLWGAARWALAQPALVAQPVLQLEARALPLTPRIALEILYMGIGCGVVAVLVQTRALQKLNAITAAIIFALEPVIATFLALVVDGAAEWPGTRGAAGAILVMLAVAVSQIRLPGAAALE